MQRLILLTSCVLLTFAAQAQNVDFSTFVNGRIDKQVAKRDPATQQFEPPANLAPNVSLVDLTAATDLVSMALNFAGAGEGQGGNTQSVTASLYSLYAGARGLDPSAPATFNSAPNLRNWFLTLGNDTGKTGAEDDARVYQLKGIVVDHRTLSIEERERLGKALTGAAESKIFARIRGTILRSPTVLEQFVLPRYRRSLKNRIAEDQIQARVEQLPGRITPDGKLEPLLDDRAFLGELLNEVLGAGFGDVLKVLSPADMKAIDSIIESELDPFLAVKDISNTLVQKMRRGVQLAVALNVHDSIAGAGTKTFGLEGIFTKGLAPGLNLTLNTAYKRPEGAVMNTDTLTVAAQLRKQMTAPIAGKDPLFLDFAADTSLLHDEKTYHAQVKAVIPITAGLHIPFSVTWANKSELVKENSSISAHLGISFDFSRVSSFFSRGMPTE
jgi:hypothetical protein